MKHDFTRVQNIYIVCGQTDMRKGIDGLATLIQDSFEYIISVMCLSEYCG